jgi:hypothetical protein
VMAAARCRIGNMLTSVRPNSPHNQIPKPCQAGCRNGQGGRRSAGCNTGGDPRTAYIMFGPARAGFGQRIDSTRNPGGPGVVKPHFPGHAAPTFMVA